MPSHDHAVELQNLRLEYLQLGAKSRDTGARKLGQPLVARIGSEPEQFIDPRRPTGATIPNSAR